MRIFKIIAFSVSMMMVALAIAAHFSSSEAKPVQSMKAPNVIEISATGSGVVEMNEAGVIEIIRVVNRQRGTYIECKLKNPVVALAGNRLIVTEIMRDCGPIQSKKIAK